MRERSQRFDPRQVMQSDSFEVFHYRDPRPGFVEVHHHDFYEVYFLLGGKVSYWVEGRIIHMTPGDLLFINPMELHRPLADPDEPVCERFVLWINRDYLERLSTDHLSLSSCFDTTRPDHSHLIRPTGGERAVLTAVWLHSAAADRCAAERGEYGMIPSDVIEMLPYIMKEITE